MAVVLVQSRSAFARIADIARGLVDHPRCQVQPATADLALDFLNAEDQRLVVVEPAVDVLRHFTEQQLEQCVAQELAHASSALYRCVGRSGTRSGSSTCCMSSSA